MGNYACQQVDPEDEEFLVQDYVDLLTFFDEDELEEILQNTDERLFQQIAKEEFSELSEADGSFNFVSRNLTSNNF